MHIVALEGSEFTIVPETEGSKLKVKEAYKALDTAISGSQTSIDLGNTPDVYAVAAVTSDDPTLQATRDAYNNYTKASITYTFGEQTVTLDGSTLKEWLQFDDKGQLVQMMLPLPSISRILWHSWQVSMIQLEQHVPLIRPVAVPFLFMALHMAGRSIRTQKQHS